MMSQTIVSDDGKNLSRISGVKRVVVSAWLAPIGKRAPMLGAQMQTATLGSPFICGRYFEQVL